MSSTIVNQSADIGSPVTATSATGLTGVYRYATSASSVSVAIPAQLQGKLLRVVSTTIDTQIGFSLSGSAVTLVLNQASALGTGHVSAGATIPAGVPCAVRVPRTATHLSWISADTSGFFEFYLDESRGV